MEMVFNYLLCINAQRVKDEGHIRAGEYIKLQVKPGSLLMIHAILSVPEED